MDKSLCQDITYVKSEYWAMYFLFNKHTRQPLKTCLVKQKLDRYALNAYADIYELSPSGEYETIFEWGDGVTEDRDKEFARRLQLVTAGKLKAEKLLAWYFGCSEDKAKEYMPDAASLFGGGL